jgi:ABC-type lipoprotein release transport system permease subunit
MAWRNIWRSTTRSMVVIVAIALGIWAAMFMSGFATGMAKSYVNNAIKNIISHIQIHHPDYADENDVKKRIEQPADVTERVKEMPSVQAVSVRSLANGMISTAQGARGIRVKGILPEDEARTSALDSNILEGDYLAADRRNPILISRELADKLNANVRSKMVLTFQNLNNEIVAGAFRVTGIYDTGNRGFNESHVFVMRNDLNRLLLGGKEAADTTDFEVAHEIAIILNDADQLESVDQKLEQAFPDLKVETYREISPELQLYESQIQSISAIYLTVIMLALIFGIVNTMLMAVLERVKELGMLMAIGMNKVRVFFMIALETVLLAVVGAPVGLLLGYLTIQYLGKYGIDLSAYSDTLSMYGMSSVIYFELDPVVYWQIPIAVAITAVLASLYPAYKAIRLKPVEAIRKI